MRAAGRDPADFAVDRGHRCGFALVQPNHAAAFRWTGFIGDLRVAPDFGLVLNHSLSGTCVEPDSLQGTPGRSDPVMDDSGPGGLATKDVRGDGQRRGDAVAHPPFVVAGAEEDPAVAPGQLAEERHEVGCLVVLR